MKDFVMALPLMLGGLQGCADQQQDFWAKTDLTVATHPKRLSLISIVAAPPKTRDPAHFPAYIVQLKQKALIRGINQQTIDQAFSQVRFIPRVIKADQKQLEKRVTLEDYLRRVLPQQRITRGKEELERYQSRLTKVRRQYDIPAPYIIALWGMESSFGKVQGKEDVISALASLAF